MSAIVDFRRRPSRLIVAGLSLVLLLVLAVVGGAVLMVRHAGSLAVLEARVGAMEPGWSRRVATAALAWAGPIIAGTPAELPTSRSAIIGMNAPAVQFFGSTVPFANLVMGSEWNDSRWGKLPEQFQDSDGGIRSLPADGVALRFLSIPPTGPAGFEVRCTFAGSGTLTVAGPARPIASGKNVLRFQAINLRGKESAPWLVLGNVDPKRPLHDLDCRDVRLKRSVRFRPEFVDTLRGYRVIRFMDWQNANANDAVFWSQRHTPASNRVDRDGISIEDMLSLLHELGADPWFVMPWNADPTYITHFATMIRTQLPVGRSVYVEVGNEVWNDGFSVGKQAIREGIERKLGTNPIQAGMRRYAERTGEVMRLWEAVFAGRSGLVRVLATQHVLPVTAQIALSFEDTAQHVDALATAPYFGAILGGTGNTRESSLAHLAGDLQNSLKLAVDNRRIAVENGKRYIGYEGGQGLVLPAQLPLADRLQHDPAMYGLYRQYLASWQHDVGDVLCLLTSVARPGPYGSWGLAAWEDETIDEAPKLRAVRDVLRQQRPSSYQPH